MPTLLENATSLLDLGGNLRWVLRIGALLCLAALIVGWWNRGPDLMSPLFAQAPGETLEDPDATPPATPAAPAKSAAAKSASEAAGGRSTWQYIVASGLIGLVIILLSFVMVAFIVEHALSIRKEVLMPERVLQPLEEMIETGKLEEAIAFCQEPQNDSLAAVVVQAGLERYRGSQFGFAEYKAAVEEAGEDQTSQLYRKTEVLGVIAAIAPMLGLLGTVQGMILAFDTIAATKGAAKPDQLADAIGLALVTTFEGLVVAIPAMIAYSFFRNLIDSLVAEAGKRVERILTPLGRQK